MDQIIREVTAARIVGGKRVRNKTPRTLLHRRFGHAKPRRLRATANSDHVDGLTWLGPYDPHCTTCMHTNAQKAPFKKDIFTRATTRGGRIHSDVKEIPVASFKGFKYAVCFVDCCTRRGKTYHIKTKDEVADKFVLFYEYCLSLDVEIKCLRSDNGGEYLCGELDAFCRLQGVRREYSPRTVKVQTVLQKTSGARPSSSCARSSTISSATLATGRRLCILLKPFATTSSPLLYQTCLPRQPG